MNIEIDGVQFQYATRFIQSKKDPTYTIADDGTLEANETTFSPSCVNGAYETSVILHRTKDDIPWQEGASVFKALGPNGEVGKIPAFAVNVKCDDVEKIGLSIQVDPRPERGLPHHANVVSWNPSSISCDAARLSANAEVVPNPNRIEEINQRIVAKLKERGIEVKKGD